jgi:hypothetical protein
VAKKSHPFLEGLLVTITTITYFLPFGFAFGLAVGIAFLAGAVLL